MTLLLVLFLVDGNWTVVEGWKPRVAPTEELCMSRKKATEEYLSEVTNDRHKVYCLHL